MVRRLKLDRNYEVLLRHQPVHRFFPRLKGWKIPLREAFEIFVEHMRQAVRPHPCRLLHIRTVQHQHFFNLRGNCLVNLRAAEVRERQHRSRCMCGHIGTHLVEQHQHLFPLTVTEIDEEDRLPFVFHKSQPFFNIVIRDHASNPSTTPYAPSSAASSADASLPPASARSGRPPPLPPTFCAMGAITLPACTREVRSLVTPTISDTLPSLAEPKTTTPEPTLSRSWSTRVRICWRSRLSARCARTFTPCTSLILPSTCAALEDADFIRT